MADQAAQRETRSWKVPGELDDVRLDSFARQCLPQLSRREVEKAIRERLFFINGKIGRKGNRLSGGDFLVFVGPEQHLAVQPPANLHLDIPIIYEDSMILVVNKPAGVATHGFSGRDTETLANFVLAKWPNLINIGKSRWEPGLVHRLDRETSGLVIVAKTQAAFERLRLELRRRQINKKYLALVWGKTEAERLIDVPLAHDPRDPRRMQPAAPLSRARKQRSWHAVTRFRKIGEAPGLSLVEVEMTTGVTHQIRVHLAAIGHAIVGDSLYGVNATETFGLERHFLHASSLEFRHPDDGRVVKLKAELPTELRTILKRLKLRL
ncbi:MAG TPA: RluA family pseudouridine synthase [Candidatus Binatia bacterium]|jgi:23S rRNA pseudouridine1911/1915/1917 synthase